MSDKINDGGPAYPCEVYTAGGHPAGKSMGMSLRDWFAGQALTGLLSSPAVQRFNGEIVECEAHYAAMAYAAADAMLKQRGES